MPRCDRRALQAPDMQAAGEESSSSSCPGVPSTRLAASRWQKSKALNLSCLPAPSPAHPQAAAGRCQAPFLHDQDWVSSTVTQYCAEECGCPATPLLRSSMAPLRSDFCCGFESGAYFAGPNGASKGN